MQKTLSKKRWALLLPLLSAEDEKPMPPLRIREEATWPKAEGSRELPRSVGLCTEVRGKRNSPKFVSRILHRNPLTPMESAASRI